MSESDNYSSQHGAADDISPALNLRIWGYFLLVGFFLMLLIGALNILFKFELDREAYRKVGSVKSRELTELRQLEAQILSGEKGLFEAKKHLSIDDAMDRYLAKVNQNAR